MQYDFDSTGFGTKMMFTPPSRHNKNCQTRKRIYSLNKATSRWSLWYIRRSYSFYHRKMTTDAASHFNILFMIHGWTYLKTSQTPNMYYRTPPLRQIVDQPSNTQISASHYLTLFSSQYHALVIAKINFLFRYNF